MKPQKPNETRAPTLEEVAELVAFLPGFESRAEPFATWEGGPLDRERKILTMPYPDYASDVDAFFQLVPKPQWVCYDYVNDRTHDLVNDVEKIKSASLEEIKAILTWCWRGERFCDGHMESVLNAGIVQAALWRLAELFPGTMAS